MNKNIKYLIEGIVNFNPVDYNDEQENILDSQTIESLSICPKTTDELKEIVVQRILKNPSNPYLLDIDISHITDMCGLFNDKNSSKGYNKYFKEYGVRSAEIFYLDLHTWNTYNVKNMSCLFENCVSLKKINLSGWDTSNVTDMSIMFGMCESLMELNLSDFDTSNVTNMCWMFSWCENLTELDLSNFNTSNVTNMGRMFSNSRSLSKLNIKGFDTSNVKNMSYMFCVCYELTELDLSSFNTSNVENMDSMFSNCINLEKIILSDKWSTFNVKETEDMFFKCESLSDIDFSNFYVCNNRLFYNGIDLRKTKMFYKCKEKIKNQFKKQAILYIYEQEH